MPKRYDDTSHARYLTFGCYRRKHLLDVESLAQIFIRHLDVWRKDNAIKLWAFVVMPNHIHLLVHSNQPSLGKQVGELKGKFGREALPLLKEVAPSYYATLLTKDHGESIHRFWQAGGGYDRNVYSDKAILKAIEYIHNNPVRAGLVSNPEDYSWSSAKYWFVGEPDPLEMDRPEWW